MHSPVVKTRLRTCILLLHVKCAVVFDGDLQINTLNILTQPDVFR